MKYSKDEFEAMILDWQADTEGSEILNIEEITKLDSGEWFALAWDDKRCYVLSDDGTGNIVLNYLGTR